MALRRCDRKRQRIGIKRLLRICDKKEIMGDYFVKISIIIPAYNVERFLGICLDSVLAQTYKNWEVLLVDDGSTDATPAICDEYGERDARIRIWHTENHGLSDTRQFALAFVTGEYVLCLDSDDCIHPEYLSRAVLHAEGKSNVVIWMGYVYVPEDFIDYRSEFDGRKEWWSEWHRGENSSGNDLKKGNFEENGCRSLTPIQAIRCIDEDGEMENEEGARRSAIDRVSACVVWGKLYPAGFFEKVSFPKGVRLHEDQRVNHRLFALANEIIYDPAPFYFYRARKQSLIRKSWRKDRLYIIKCYLDRLGCVKTYADTPEGRRLIELVYRRLLICIIRNYGQMRENLRGQERRQESHRLTALYRKLWRDNRNIALPGKKKVILHLFCAAPHFVAWMFRVRDSVA